jgi:ABC-type thiamine transport system substrate-binding protein
MLSTTPSGGFHVLVSENPLLSTGGLGCFAWGIHNYGHAGGVMVWRRTGSTGRGMALQPTGNAGGDMAWRPMID